MQMQQTIVRIETKSNIYTLEIRNQNLQISWYRISSLKSVSDTVSYHVSQKITVPPIPPILAVQINGMGIAGALFTPLLLIVLPFHPVPNPPNPLNPPTTSILIGKKILLKTVYNQNFLFGISRYFIAKIRINGKADRIADVEINALGCYLRKENYESKSILVEWYFRSRRLWI
ncbi:fungal-specific transcription factor domain-containing protein [Rhizophagus irregularis DAOM 181602=DAOM 197198]|nr:fungal-specific transcription factor domain-containing protein [Rhizophagus irregularis DAOM 181602=DAOM 197198]